MKANSKSTGIAVTGNSMAANTPKQCKDEDAPINYIYKALRKSSNVHEVLAFQLEVAKRKLNVSRNEHDSYYHGSEETQTLHIEDAIEEYQRMIKYCEKYIKELQTAINNTVMAQVVK